MMILLQLIRVTLFQALTLVGIKKASPDIASAMPNLAPGLIFLIAACLRYLILLQSYQCLLFSSTILKAMHEFSQWFGWSCRFEKFDACCWYSRAKILGTLVCLTGAMAMCFLQSPSESPSLTSNLSALLSMPFTLDKAIYSDWMLGCFYLLIGVVFLSCTTVLQVSSFIIFLNIIVWSLQAATMLEFQAPLSLVVVTSVMGSLLTALWQVISEGNISVGPSTLSIARIVGVVLLGGVLVGVCVAFQTWCISKKGPVLVAIFSPIQTVSTVVLSAILLGQMITPGRSDGRVSSFCSLAGIVLMFAGLYVVLWAKNNEDLTAVGGNDDPQPHVEDVEKPLLS
ncbi:hypothetical protein BHE74_00046593 [Ensete ventricosum]|nr:hypothetical protein BHE74_00046593 [Ensete ventricosum]